MRFVRSLFCLLLLIVILPSTIFAEEDQRPSHLLLAATEIKEPEPMSYRRGAKHMLVIHVRSVVLEAKLNTKSKTWDAIHRELSKSIKKHGGEHALHVRLFYERGIWDRKTFDKLKEHVKRHLADLDIYVVMVDKAEVAEKHAWNGYVDKLKQRISKKK